jgi:hypothetical protein
VQRITVGVLQHIVNGGDAHFDAGITFPQQFYGILFDHFKTSLVRMVLICPFCSLLAADKNAWPDQNRRDNEITGQRAIMIYKNP